MIHIIVRRLLISIPLIFVVSLVTFVFQSFLPGDPARSLLGDNASPAQYAALRQELHLDEPLLTQYWLYISDVLHGNLGQSLFTGNTVTRLIAGRLPVTLTLIVGGVILATMIGVALGIQSATGGRIWSRVVDILSLVGSALPSFWIALVLVAIFAVGLDWFPATGFVPFDEDPIGWATFLVLPVVALSVHGIAAISKVTRDSLMSALQMDFIRTLRAAGVAPRSLVYKHGLRNASVAIMTIVGVIAVHFIAGAVFVENVFALPGLGALMVDSTNKHDLPVVQGIALTLTLLVVAINILVDISYGFLDPRVRLS
jgi:peptide/nickel transport system permease protein